MPSATFKNHAAIVCDNDSAQPCAAPPVIDDAAVVLPDIDGIDTALGMQNSGDAADLYLELLSIFVADYCDFIRNFVHRVSAGEWADARRLAHTLKSVTGVLGITQVRASAEQLELACKQQSAETIRERLAVLEIELSSVLGALQRFFASETCLHGIAID